MMWGHGMKSDSSLPREVSMDVWNGVRSTAWNKIYREVSRSHSTLLFKAGKGWTLEVKANECYQWRSRSTNSSKRVYSKRIRRNTEDMAGAYSSSKITENNSNRDAMKKRKYRMSVRGNTFKRQHETAVQESKIQKKVHTELIRWQ